MSSSSRYPSFDISIVGDAGVGKTEWLSCLKNWWFQPKYTPSIGVNVDNLTIKTTAGNINFTIWDYPNGSTGKADACILMFDITNKETYKNLDKHYKNVIEQCENIPIAIVGNKIDCSPKELEKKDIVFPEKHNLAYYEISVRIGGTTHHPLIYLLRKLTGDWQLDVE